MKHTATDPVDEAAEWLATLSDPACTADERKAFTRWLRRSNVNVEEFLTLSVLARRLERSDTWPKLDVAQLIAKAQQTEYTVVALHTATASAAPATTGGVWRRVSWVAVAATVALIFFGPIGGLSRSTYATGIGELRSVTLPDGSIVQLDADSRIRIHFDSRQRLIELLHGAAIFTVAKSPDRPFKVTAGTTDIVAVGTAFNVSAREERTVVTVIEGRVRVDTRDERGAASAVATQLPLELNPGQQVLIEPKRSVERTAGVDVAKVTAWTSRRLYFEDTSLAEAAQEFARYSSRKILINDPALAQKRITGTFDAADPGALVGFLKRYTDTHVDTTADGWIVEK